MKISVGIGNEVKESAIQLSQMVRPSYFFFLNAYVSDLTPALIERCILRNRRHPCGYFPTHEQHGSTAGLSLAMVHRLLGHRLLVLHDYLVASTVKLRFLQSHYCPLRVYYPTYYLNCNMSLRTPRSFKLPKFRISYWTSSSVLAKRKSDDEISAV